MGCIMYLYAAMYHGVLHDMICITQGLNKGLIKANPRPSNTPNKPNPGKLGIWQIDDIIYIGCRHPISMDLRVRSRVSRSCGLVPPYIYFHARAW
jgi:hypothetical protein